MPAMPPVDPNNPPWKGRINKVKKLAYNKGFNDGLNNKDRRTSFHDEQYVAEYERGYDVGQQRRRLDV